MNVQHIYALASQACVMVRCTARAVRKASRQRCVHAVMRVWLLCCVHIGRTHNVCCVHMSRTSTSLSLSSSRVAPRTSKHPSRLRGRFASRSAHTVISCAAGLSPRQTLSSPTPHSLSLHPPSHTPNRPTVKLRRAGACVINSPSSWSDRH